MRIKPTNRKYTTSSVNMPSPTRESVLPAQPLLNTRIRRQAFSYLGVAPKFCTSKEGTLKAL